MPIRVMHVVDHLGKGGLENGLVNLINGLDSRFEHVVYAIRQLGPNAERLPKDRVVIVCQGKRDSDSPVQVRRLARAIREAKPDIVHSRNWAAIEAVVAARWVRSCAVVHGEHGLEAGPEAREPRRRRWFRRLAFELADRVLCVSNQLRELHARRTGFGSDRITVIHNGVDGRRFFADAAARAHVRAQWGISENVFCIGCVGNLLPVKDHMTLLKALERAAGEIGDWRLIIAGEGPERSNLERFIAAHPEWSGRVWLPGTSDRVPELLRGMDVFVLPSAAEGMCNALLEAMSSGLPVIATAAGGNPEAVVDGESGLLFPVGDCGRLADLLVALAAQPEARLGLGARALRRVRDEFSIDSMVRGYAEVYDSLRHTAADPVRAVVRA